jgi:hypothetical protein
VGSAQQELQRGLLRPELDASHHSGVAVQNEGLVRPTLPALEATVPLCQVDAVLLEKRMPASDFVERMDWQRLQCSPCSALAPMAHESAANLPQLRCWACGLATAPPCVRLLAERRVRWVSTPAASCAIRLFAHRLCALVATSPSLLAAAAPHPRVEAQHF